MKINELRPGDVLFFRTNRVQPQEGLDGLVKAGVAKLDLVDGENDTGDFAALAALVQTYPYGVAKVGYRPWYHVAVFVGGANGTDIVGFSRRAIDQTEETAVQAEPTIMAEPLDIAELSQAEVAIDVVRPPIAVGQPLAAKAVEAASRNVRYNAPGLVSFGTASIAWLMPDGPAREQQLKRARGASGFAEGDPGETCTTSTAKWIEAASNERLEFREPPAIPADHRADAEAENEVKTVVAMLSSRFVYGRLGESLRQPAGDEGPLITSRLGEPVVYSDDAASRFNTTARRLDPKPLFVVENGMARWNAAAGIRLLPQQLSDLNEVLAGVLDVDPEDLLLPQEIDLASMPAVRGVDFSEVVEVHRHGSMAFSGVTDQDLVDGGEDYTTSSASLFLSPAMLWESLVFTGWAQPGTIAG